MVRKRLRAAGRPRATEFLLSGFLALAPSIAGATHQGLEQLGLVSAHADACVGFISAGCQVGFFGTEIDPTAIADEVDAQSPYPGSITAQVSPSPGLARSTVVFGTGTFPVFQLHAENDISAALEFSASQASAYWQDEITITAPSLPNGTQLLFVPSFSISGQLLVTDEGLGGSRQANTSYQVLAGRLNEGLNMELGVDGRFLADVFCSPDDTLHCGIFSHTYGGPTGLPVPGIPFFNGGPFTFRFIALVAAGNSGVAALGTSLGWLGVSVQDLQGSALAATIDSEAGIDYTKPSELPEPISGTFFAMAALAVLAHRRSGRRASR